MMNKNEMNFVMFTILKSSHASIFISKAYTTIEKLNSKMTKDEFEKYAEEMKDDSSTNMIIKIALYKSNYNRNTTFGYLQDLQNNKENKLKEFEEELSKLDRKEMLIENFKYKYRKALDIKVRDIDMNLVDKVKYDNKNVTKKKNYNKKKKDNKNN